MEILPSQACPASKGPHGALPYILAVVACGLTTLIATPLLESLDLANIVMLFLLTVLLVAVRLGRRAGVLAAFCSVACFDFFFVPPRFSLTVHDGQYLITFVVMLVVALITSHLTTGLQRQAQEAREKEARSRALYDLARGLGGAVSMAPIEELTASFLQSTLGAEFSLLVSNDQGSFVPAKLESHPLSLAADLSARVVLNSGRGLASDNLKEDGKHTIFLPLQGATRLRGVLMVSVAQERGEVLDQQRPMLEAVASLVATAVERLHFVEVAQAHQIQAATERLRSSILSALSHDVRTPLTTLYGLADSLLLAPNQLPESAQSAISSIRDQAMRLNGMVGNLLDMAKLQAGQINLKREWQPLEEVIGAAIKLLGNGLQQHPVKVSLPQDLPLLNFDAVLMERVFCNLLENAAKYSPQGAAISLGAGVEGEACVVRIHNPGVGFPADSLERVFNLFERGRHESTIAGVGVGLAICRAIVEAHGGCISALNPPEGGATVRFSLPLGNPPTLEPEAEEGSPS